LGIKEYWIVDADAEKVTTLKRGPVRLDGKGTACRPNAIETKLLPGFRLSCQAIFAAAAMGGGIAANSELPTLPAPPAQPAYLVSL